MRTPQQSCKLPAEVRFLLLLAESLLPHSVRRDWRREWWAEFFHSFVAESTPKILADQRRHMFQLAMGAISDSWALLKIYGISRRFAEATTARLTAGLAPMLMLLALGLVTHGFRPTRTLVFNHLPQEIILITQPSPFMGRVSRVPLAQAKAWKKQSALVDTMGIFTFEHEPKAGEEGPLLVVDRTGLDLFQQASIQPPTNMQLGVTDTMPAYSGVIARLKPGITALQAEAELAGTADVRKGWLAPRAVPLARIRQVPLIPVGVILAGLWLAGILGIRVRSCGAGLWAVAIITLWYLVILAGWLELISRLPLTETGSMTYRWSLVVYFAPIAAGLLTLRAFRRGSSRRCRTCFQPLTAAVSVGMEGRHLFEPGGSEFLCAEGHGALIVGHAAQSTSDEIWTSWSSDWEAENWA